MLVIEGHWFQIEAQIKYLKRVWHRLHGRLQIHFNHVLSRLQALLYDANMKIDGLIEGQKDNPRTEQVKNDNRPTDQVKKSVLAVISKEGRWRRGAFALNQKDALDRLIKELGSWHNDMFGPSWFQLLRFPELLETETSLPNPSGGSAPVIELCELGRDIDTANHNIQSTVQNMLLPSDAVEEVPLPIFGSPAKVCRRKGSDEVIIVDTVFLPADVQRQRTLESFCQLAQKLQRSEVSSNNILRCWGVVDGGSASTTSSIEDHFLLLFHSPEKSSEPRSLREVLLESSRFYALEKKVSLAVQLAKSVMFIHSLGLVHKNIRPETVLLFHSVSKGEDQAMLLGFEQFRPMETRSLLRGDTIWQKAIYRHPNRQGLHPEKEYVMQHDIYSLGVCLLEIGLWRSFILDPNGRSWPLPEVDTKRIPGKEAVRKAHVLKERYQALAQSDLPATMGQRYADVVLSCLTCLDHNDTEFGDERDFEDDDEMLVGVRYMEKVSIMLRVLLTYN